MTYRYVCYDIEKALKQSFDDADITLSHILYWVQVVANKLRSDSYKVNKEDPYISTFRPVNVLTETGTNRKYIDLPVPILNLKFDAGVRWITYNFETNCCDGDPLSQIQFDRTTPSALRNLYGDPYTTPSPKTPFFFRIAHKVNNVSVNRLYLLGLECVDVETVEIGVLTSLNPKDVCNLDDEIPLSDDLVHTLITEVLKLGRFMIMIPEERINDGDDQAKGVVPKIPVASPREIQPQTEAEQ